MENYNHLLDKKIALIVWNAADENDVRVFLGEIIHANEEFRFVNQTEHWNLHLNTDQLDSTNEVSDELKSILLDADYAISLSIEQLPTDSTDGFINTGMSWNSN